MRLREFRPTKPKTADQQRLDSLKSTAQRANRSAKIEQQRQKMVKAQQSMAKLRMD